MSSYSNEEKVLIAKNHIIPKQITQHALSLDYIVFEDDSIPTMIEYTYEAGVRQLERTVGAVCRNVALRVAESINGGNVDADIISTDLKTPVRINAAAVDEILKKVKIIIGYKLLFSFFRSTRENNRQIFPRFRNPTKLGSFSA